jgi:hypothetical protein
MPIRDTLQPPFDRARWLRRLARGAELGVLAMMIVAAGGLIVVAGMFRLSFFRTFFSCGVFLLLMVGLLLAVCAGWILSTPDHGQGKVGGEWDIFVRGLLFLGVPVFFCAMVAGHTVDLFMGGP